jgi:hypothetical protein
MIEPLSAGQMTVILMSALLPGLVVIKLLSAFALRVRAWIV